MKLDKNKFELAKARACVSTKDLVETGIPRGTLSNVRNRNLRPETAGKIAKALGVDINEIISIEE